MPALQAVVLHTTYHSVGPSSQDIILSSRNSKPGRNEVVSHLLCICKGKGLEIDKLADISDMMTQKNKITFLEDVARPPSTGHPTVFRWYCFLSGFRHLSDSKIHDLKKKRKNFAELISEFQ